MARNLNLVLNVALVGFMALSGVNFPVAELPAWAQIISGGLPITRGLAAFRMAFAGGGAAATGYLLFLRLERSARLEGTFDFQA